MPAAASMPSTCSGIDKRTELREPSELARRWPSRDGRRRSQTMPLHLAARGETSLTPRLLPSGGGREGAFVKKSEEKMLARRPYLQNKSSAGANERVLGIFSYCSVYQHLVLILQENGMPDALNGGAVLIARSGR